MRIKKVYIASPLFNPKELKENEEIDQVLQNKGFETFLPQRDGFLYTELVEEAINLGCTKEQAENITLKLIDCVDTYQIAEECDATVFNMNGRVPDEGAIVEATIAYVIGKPLVIYKNDVRTLVGGKDNPLVTGLTNFKIVNDIYQIPEELRKLEILTEHSFFQQKVNTGRELTEKRSYHDIKPLIKLAKRYFL